jgi:hypothetical protein
MIDQFCHLAFLMLAAHALCDGPLQRPELSAAKRLPGALGLQGLLVHSLIHGGAVAAITGIWQFGLAETISHAVIDRMKCAKRINHVTDQALHLLCKVCWAGMVVIGSGQ